MTPIEIFSEIYNHQIQGIMFHTELASLFDFMGLRGYKRQHEYQAFCEFAEARSVSRYAINHLNKMIGEPHGQPKAVTPQSWKNATRFDVGESDRKQYIREAFKRWKEWEVETKELYQRKFKELTEQGHIACANKVNELICDVDYELKFLEREIIKLSAIGYEMNYIIMIQDDIHKKYEEKEKEIGISFN